MWTRTSVEAKRGRDASVGAFIVAFALSFEAHAATALTGDAEGARIEAARATLARGDHAAAVEQYAAAIELIEQRNIGPGLELFEPLIELAEAQAAVQRHGDAIDSLHRAVGVLRREAGLYDERQFAVLLRLVDLHSSVGEIEAAADVLQYLERLSANLDASIDRADALTGVAEWRCRLGQFDEGRSLYRKALKLLDARERPEAFIRVLRVAPNCCLHELSAEGVATTPGLLEQYRGPIARSGRLALDSPALRFHGLRFLRTEGEQALVQAARLAPHADDPALQLATLVQVGDWFQMKDHTRTARRYYARAEALARTEGPDHALSTPVLLFYPLPPLALRYRNEPAGQFVERLVEVEFTVRVDGRIDRERVLVRDAGKSAVDETLSALRAARFRPRVVNGKAVDVEGVRHRQAFREMK